jgi:pyruvate dehydrogenase E1 component alpha subunit
MFEEKVVELYRKGELIGLLHLYIGEEAVAAGVTAALSDGDVVISTHRGHGHAVAKGVSLKNLMAELYGKATGTSMGISGSMHLVDTAHGLPISSSIVGSGIPICVGMAYAYKLSKSGNVAVCFFGDGATYTGLFHESLNLANVLKVPAIFVCENNQYALSLPTEGVAAHISEVVGCCGLKVYTADGMDAIDVYMKAKDAVEYARKTGMPVFIEAKTYRYLGHHLGDILQPYRSKEDIDEWRKRDPITRMENILMQEYGISEQELVKIKDSIAQELNEAVEFARQSPYLDPKILQSLVYAEATM